MIPSFKNTFFVLLHTIILVPPTSGEDPYEWRKESLHYGPFDIEDKGKETMVPIWYHYHYEVEKTVYETLTITTMDNRTLFYRGTKMHNIHERDFGFSVDFEVPLYKYLDSSGYKIVFSVIDANTNKLFHDPASLDIFPINTETFNPFATNDKTYQSKPVVSYFLWYPTYYVSTYDFSGLVDEFDGKDSRYLHYPICSFKYEYEKEPFTYKEAYIKFFDKKNLFPYYTKSSDGYKHIPVSLVYNEQSKSIEVRIKQEFYVKKDTMQVSDIYRKGFEMTEFFALPHNFEYYINEYNFEMVMMDLGADKLDVIYPISFGHSRGFFGLCKDSEYCVTGGVVE